MYYTQSTVCQSVIYERNGLNTFLSSSPWAYAGFAKGELNFFGDGQVACREEACDSWRSQAFARGVRGHASTRIFLNSATSYFHKLFIDKNLEILIFYTKIMINCSHVLARGFRSMVH